jgi:hypothetical protein
MAINNFIRQSAIADRDFEMCDRDEYYVPMAEPSNSQQRASNTKVGDEDNDMNAFRDEIANGLYNRS